MKRVVIVGLVILIQLSGIAQSKSDLKNANEFYKEGNYYNSIVNYEIYLGIRKPVKSFAPYTLKRKLNTEVIDSTPAALKVLSTSNLVTPEIAWQLGESYRRLYHFQRAEPCYARVVATNATANYPLAHYWYGVSLRANNKFDEAEKQFKIFLGENKNNAENAKLANNELLTIGYIKKQLKSVDQSMSFNKLKGNVSQVEGAYAPFVYNDTLLFTSARIVDTVNKYSTTNQHVNHLFFNTLTNENAVAGNAIMVHFPSKLSQNEGTASLSHDKTKLYFSRSIEENGKPVSSIYVSSRLSNGDWSEPQKLDSKINNAGFSSIQPCVTADNKYLLFASDRDGGIGKFDIWYSAIDASGNLGEPVNLKSINTKDDDEAPFYHTNSHTLVFASKGYLGMGGFDLYSATGDITSLKTPVNLGYPTNSPKDDIYFFSDSKDSLLKKSYVSSDRASDCCLELFAVNKVYVVKHKQSIEGIVSDCEAKIPLAASAVSVSSNTPDNYTLTTSQSGAFSIAVADSITGFKISKDGYQTKEIGFATVKNITADTVYKVLACLDKIPVIVKDTAAIVDSVNISDKPLIVYFDFNKFDLKTQYYVVLDQVVSILKHYPTISISLSINGYTDALGTDEYNLKLGQRRAESCKQYILSKGVDEKRLVVKSYGKAIPAAANTTADNKDNPEGRALNRRVELSVKAEKSK